MLYRLGANAKIGKDNFTKYTLALALHVRPETIESWITRGWLKATQTETGRGKRVVIQAEDFCEFCQNTRKISWAVHDKAAGFCISLCLSTRSQFPFACKRQQEGTRRFQRALKRQISNVP
jgi:hypothetical protein